MMWSIFRLVPKNAVSFFVGLVTRIPSCWAARVFGKLVGIDMAEAELPLVSSGSIEALFTRRLRAGARPCVAPMCSPADGKLTSPLAPVLDGRLLSAKGSFYTPAELFFGRHADGESVLAAPVRSTFTIYLAPHNYHRVHSPVAGRLICVRHLPGELWPVNPPSVRNVPRLFARNERVTFEIEADFGGKIYLAMVGAMNVGRIEVAHMEKVIANTFFRQISCRPRSFSLSERLNLGDELGTFMLGSTVVVGLDAVAADGLSFLQLACDAHVVVGQQMAKRNSNT